MNFEIYQAGDGWRWRLRARNGRIVADGGEAYVSKAGAIRAARRVAKEAEWAGIGEVPA